MSASDHTEKSATGVVRENIILPFEVANLSVRGRMICLGDTIDKIIQAHDYPNPVAILLAQAVALTGILGTLLKFDGKFILQTQTDGPVGFMVVDYTTPGKLRGLARYDDGKVAQLEASGCADTVSLMGAGHLALTIDQGSQTERYQAVVALEGLTLSEAANSYFRQSEQIPTSVILAAGPVIGKHGPDWRAGGLLIQHLPAHGEARIKDLSPGDLPPGVAQPDIFIEDDSWTRARALTNTVEDHELLDPMLSSEQLLYRLFHEDGVRVFDGRPLEWHCHCARDKTLEMLAQFSDVDRRYMIKDGVVIVTCEFCNTTYEFDPDHLVR